MAQPSKFWDRHAKGYAKRPVADEAAYQKKLRVTQDYLKPDMEVLEFGCGTGTTAIIHAPFVRHIHAIVHAPFVRHIHAIDISSKMLEIARTKAESDGIKNVTFEQSGIDELNADDAGYDAVMGHSILHLLENKENAIASVYRMLKTLDSGLTISGNRVRANPCSSWRRSRDRLVLKNTNVRSDMLRWKP